MSYIVKDKTNRMLSRITIFIKKQKKCKWDINNVREQRKSLISRAVNNCNKVTQKVNQN